MKKPNYQKRKKWIFRIVCLCVIIFIWVLFIAPLLGGLNGILIGTFEVIDPEIDYSNRNNTKPVVYNGNCNVTDSNSYSLAYNWTTFNGTCPSMYVFNGTLCVPECIKWNPGGDAYFWIYRISTLLGAVFQLGMCLVFSIAWVQAGKSVWKFPTVTSFYLMIALLIQSFAILSGAIIPERFYCSSVELAKSRESSTIACRIQGAVFQYGIFAFMLWYLCAFVNLTILIAFPLHVTKIMKYYNKIHLFEFLICFLAPVLVVIVSYFGDTSGQGYRILNVPEVCFPQDEFIFVTLYLPGILFSLILGTLSVIILYKLFTQQFISSAGQGLQRTLITDLAFQVIVFLISFGALIWIIMIDFIVYENLKLPYIGYLQEYIRCITDFNGNSSCCETVFRDYYSSWLSTLAGFFFTFWGSPALLALAGRVIHTKCCVGFRKERNSDKTKFTSVAPNELKRLHTKVSIRSPTQNSDEENIDHTVVANFKRSGTIAAQKSFYDDLEPKKADKFKKQGSSDRLELENET